MRLSKCPDTQALFELVSMPRELSLARRTFLNTHNRFCADCRQKASALTERWAAVFAPEIDVTSSLLRVYSRLQRDETLVIKGWKLSETRQASHAARAAQDWMFRGAVAFGALAVAVWVVGPEVFSTNGQKALMNASAPIQARSARSAPFAQIRTEDKNSIKVHYVQPELLHSVEFETIGQK